VPAKTEQLGFTVPKLRKMKRKILVFNNKQLRIYLFEAGVMLLIILFFSGCLLTKTRRFGNLPEGSQLKYIKQLPNYRAQHASFGTILFCPYWRW
jgi:hypothetical protein